MTSELLIRGVMALIFSAVFAWGIFDRSRDRDGDGSRQRYLPYISGSVLPACVLALLICSFILSDAKTAVGVTVTFCFGVFLHICIYYLLLMPALPFLRRHISARA